MTTIKVFLFEPPHLGAKHTVGVNTYNKPCEYETEITIDEARNLYDDLGKVLEDYYRKIGNDD